MPITVTIPSVGGAAPSAPLYHQRLNVVLDNSYPAGGYLLGLQARIGAGKSIISVQARGVVTSSGFPDVRSYEYNATTDKLVALTGARADVAAATDLSTVTVEVLVTSN